MSGTPSAGILAGMHRTGSFAAALALLLASAAGAGTASVPSDPRSRVEHHLVEVQVLARHFGTVLATDCPRFASEAEWKSYFDGEVHRVVLLIAHLEQAWVEAKQTPDKDVRRTAKAPRREVDRGRALLDKLQQCASDHGSSFAPLVVWQRIEREVPRRQAQIALP